MPYQILDSFLSKICCCYFKSYLAKKTKTLDTEGIKLNMLENCPLLSCLVFGMTLEYKLLKVLPFSSHIGICLRINLKSFNLCFGYT